MSSTEVTPDMQVASATAAQADEVEELLGRAQGTDYIDQIVQLYEESERNYRAAASMGQVVYGFTDSTNY